MASYGERFSEFVRGYLLKHKLLGEDGLPRLGYLNGQALAVLADDFEQAERRDDKRIREKKLSKAERSKLFDALAKGADCNLEAMTEAEQKRTAVAIAAIIKATPDVTPEEIQDACNTYRKKMSGATITPTAISNNWSKVFDSSRRIGGIKTGLVMEPKGDWRPAMLRVVEAMPEGKVKESRRQAYVDGYKWYQLGPEFRSAICEEFEKSQPT